MSRQRRQQSTAAILCASMLSIVACTRTSDGGSDETDKTTRGDTGTESTTTTDASDTSEASESSDSTDEGGTTCSEGNIECDGKCHNPLTSNEACGGCGNVCSVVYDAGGCVDGTCSPTWASCFEKGQFATCDEACGAENETCVEKGCSTHTFRTFEDSWECDNHSTEWDWQRACDWPIDWEWDGTEFDVARCCCTDTN